EISSSTVSGYVWRAKAAGLTWPLPPELGDDAALERLLFSNPGRPRRVDRSRTGRDKQLIARFGIFRPGVSQRVGLSKCLNWNILICQAGCITGQWKNLLSPVREMLQALRQS